MINKNHEISKQNIGMAQLDKNYDKKISRGGDSIVRQNHKYNLGWYGI